MPVSEFNSPLDIGNTAMQLLGQRQMVSLTEGSLSATEFNACYDRLRVAELRRNIWRFAIRRAAIRAIDTTTLIITPAAWSSTTTYQPGAIVEDANGLYWTTDRPDVVGTQPGTAGDRTWTRYFGPLTAYPWNTSAAALTYGLPAGPPSTTTQIPVWKPTGADAYFSGELVYITKGDGNLIVYRSLVSGNGDDPRVASEWDYQTTYDKGDVTVWQWQTYQSTIEVNVGNVPGPNSTQWVQVAAAKSAVSWAIIPCTYRSARLLYPVGAGPVSNTATRNVYRLPAGFLREAPRDPKAGSVSYLGAPSGLPYTDWLLEGDFLVTHDVYPIVLRFGADVSDVSSFDPMFANGLACRVGLALCERLTGGADKFQMLSAEYAKFMDEARTVNGIETGATQPPEDDYITCRL